MAAGTVVMAPYTNMPDDVRGGGCRKRQPQSPPASSTPSPVPMYKQDGTLAVAEGEVMDDGTLAGINWYVQGVDDTLPE